MTGFPMPRNAASSPSPKRRRAVSRILRTAWSGMVLILLSLPLSASRGADAEGTRSGTSSETELRGVTAVLGEPPITALAFAPDGRSFLAASQRGVSEWTWPELERVREFPNPWLALHDLQFSPAGDHLALAGGDPSTFGGIAVWKWPEATLLADAVGHDDVVYRLVWKSSGDGLLTTAGDHTVWQWSGLPGLRASGPVLAGHSRAVTAAVLLPETDLLVTAGRDHSLRLWHAGQGRLLRTLDQHTGAITALAVRPTRPGPPWLASCGEDRTVRFWQPTIGRLVRFVRLPSVPLSLAWFPDGEQIAVGCRDGRVRLVPATGRGEVEERPALSGWGYSLAVAPDGAHLVVAGEWGELRVLKRRQ
jgi:WD40 repeat protein